MNFVYDIETYKQMKKEKEKFVHDGTEIWVDHYVPYPDFENIEVMGKDWHDSEKTGTDIKDIVNKQDIIFKESWGKIPTENTILDRINKGHLKLVNNEKNN